MDALSAILQSLRIRSTLISRADLTSPWGLQTGAMPGSIFHAVVEGRATARRSGGDEILQLNQGDVVIFTHGDGHVMADDPASEVVPIARLATERSTSLVGRLVHGGGGAQTRLICGHLTLEHPASASAWSLLPPMMVVRQEDAAMGEWLNTNLDLMASELDASRPGSEEVVRRLLDILLIQVIRQVAQALPADGGGWLGAMRDERVAEAVALIHRDPAERWTSTRLATRVGMSRSVLFSRFTKLVGEPPGQYLTRWRMHTAVDLMRQEALSTAELAERVGYASEDAFAKAFAREIGVSPAVYRRSASSP